MMGGGKRRDGWGAGGGARRVEGESVRTRERGEGREEGEMQCNQGKGRGEEGRRG